MKLEDQIIFKIQRKDVLKIVPINDFGSMNEERLFLQWLDF